MLLGSIVHCSISKQRCPPVLQVRNLKHTAGEGWGQGVLGRSRGKDRVPALELGESVTREVQNVMTSGIHITALLQVCPTAGTGHLLLSDSGDQLSCGPVL